VRLSLLASQTAAMSGSVFSLLNSAMRSSARARVETRLSTKDLTRSSWASRVPTAVRAMCTGSLAKILRRKNSDLSFHIAEDLCIYRHVCNARDERQQAFWCTCLAWVHEPAIV
ncbi:hypothetical protein JI435_107020, partial [Parastagonospora nodorum SN15]